jgi:hypothetical protein
MKTAHAIAKTRQKYNGTNRIKNSNAIANIDEK